MDSELPAEVLEEINSKAEAFANKYLNGKVNTNDFAIIEDTYNACATEYAKKLHQSRALLEKFISRHEAGLLPDRFIYQEIKNFLDGK